LGNRDAGGRRDESHRRRAIMKNYKMILCASGLAIAGLLAFSTVHAAEPKSDEAKAAEKADRKAKKEAKDAENLAKYDVNKNGKLDTDEKAAMKADADRAKEEKKEKKERDKKEKMDKN
jgi:hypothetical protein